MIDDRIYDIDFEKITDDLSEAAEYIKEDDYDGALEIIDELLEEYEGIYKEDEKERYFCFDSPVQFYVYDMLLTPKKICRPSKIDYRTLYYSKAQIDFANERYEAAEENLKKALYWNPVDSNIFFLLAKIYTKKENTNLLAIVLRAVRDYILDKVSLAKYYAYLGEYERLKGNNKIALALYYSSQSIYETSTAKNGIEIIISKESQNAPAIEEVCEALLKDNFSYQLNGDVLGMIYDLSYEMQKNLNLKGAMYCLDILYELTEDEKYLREKEYLM